MQPEPQEHVDLLVEHVLRQDALGYVVVFHSEEFNVVDGAISDSREETGRVQLDSVEDTGDEHTARMEDVISFEAQKSL